MTPQAHEYVRTATWIAIAVFVALAYFNGWGS
jgi:hypothetical protein